MNTHRLLAVANFFIYEVLRVPPTWNSSAGARYLGAGSVFFASGIFHVALDVAAGQ